VTKSQVLWIGNESVGEERRIGGVRGRMFFIRATATRSTKKS
jgi:hypothetical protein